MWIKAKQKAKQRKRLLFSSHCPHAQDWLSQQSLWSFQPFLVGGLCSRGSPEGSQSSGSTEKKKTEVIYSWRVVKKSNVLPFYTAPTPQYLVFFFSRTMKITWQTHPPPPTTENKLACCIFYFFLADKRWNVCHVILPPQWGGEDVTHLSSDKKLGAEPYWIKFPHSLLNRGQVWNRNKVQKTF